MMDYHFVHKISQDRIFILMTKKEAIAEIMQLLRRIFKAIRQYSEEVLKKFGAAGPQLWALRTLHNHGPLSMGELSDRMYLHISTISGIIDRLENKDYVKRRRDHLDRRVVKISLTSKGRKLVQKAPEAAQGRLLYGLESLSKRQVHIIHTAF